MLHAGYAKRDITPPGQTVLGGYFMIRKRLSTSVRDPLYVRAVAFGDEQPVVLLVFDQLVITTELRHAIEERLPDVRVMCVATHTHSAPGGYWAPFVARLSLGPYDAERVETLVSAGVDAAREALENRAPARFASTSTSVDSIAINRRDVNRAVDAQLWIARLWREDGDITLCGFPSHPIVCAEKAHNEVSADFPGYLVERLEETLGGHAVFINGPLAGVGTLLVGDSVEENFDAIAGPIVEKATGLSLDADQPLESVALETAEMTHAAIQPRAAFDNQHVGKLMSFPLDLLARGLFSSVRESNSRLSLLRLNDACIVGVPGEPSSALAAEIRSFAADQGFKECFVSSHCGGYIGYLHDPAEYAERPTGDTLGMAMYENIMNVYGHDTGREVLDTACSLLR